MDEFNSHDSGGSLQISIEVVEKIARHAALEVPGVCDVVPFEAGPRSLVSRIVNQNPISVQMKNDVADITVALTVEYGTRIPELSEAVQRNVKEAVQSMTSISVAKVDVFITGLAGEGKEDL